MQDKLVNYFMLNIKNNNKNLDNIKLEEIRYGLLGLYTIITKTSVIILISIILGIFKNFIVFLLFYSILRSVGFGTHAKSNILCWISSIVMLIGIPYLFNLFTLKNNTKFIIWLICFISYLLFCPADTEKRPMINKVRKLKFKLIILIISFIYLFLILKFSNISNIILASMVLESFLVSPIAYILMGNKVRFRMNDIFVFSKK